MQAERSQQAKAYLHDLAVAFTLLGTPCSIKPGGNLEVRLPGVELGAARNSILGALTRRTVTLLPLDGELWWWWLWDEDEPLLDPLGPAEDIAGAAHKILHGLQIESEISPRERP